MSEIMKEAKEKYTSETSRRLLTAFLVVGFIAAFFVFFDIVGEVTASGMPDLDTQVNEWLLLIQSPLLMQLFTFLTELGSVWVLGSLFIIMLLWLWLQKRDYIGMLVTAIAILGGQGVNKGAKIFFARERPSIQEAIDAVGYSFPSAHAMMSFISYGLLAFFVLHYIKTMKVQLIVVFSAMILIFFIGFSRIYLSAHYPTDIAGGFALGYIWLMVCIFIYERFTTIYVKSKKHQH